MHDDLAVLWKKERLTSTEIAERTGLTRNVVIGRLDRAGLLGKMGKRERWRRIKAGHLRGKREPAGANAALSFGA